jgi:hypothetical protein
MPDAHSPDTVLATTLATWIFLLHVDGHHADDADVHQACANVAAATEEASGNAAGLALVERVAAALDGTDVDAVTSVLRQWYGERLDTELGKGSREERIHRIRQYQFSHSLPWLARIWERQQDGSVAPTWLVVERVTDQVTAMDPDPWNDIDETRHLPVQDFQVLWELDACTALSLA